MRAESKVLVHFLATLRADPKWFILEGCRWRPATLIKNPAAAVALQKDPPPFDRKEGDEKEAQVMVQPLEAGGRQAALGAGPWLVIYLNLLGLYTADEKEEDPPPEPG